MKKIILPLTLLIVGVAIGYFACKFNPKQSNTDYCKNPNYINSVDIVNNIDTARARTMVQRYKTRSMPIDVPGTRTKKENSRCVWFNIDSLKNFVDKTKCENGDGVRIYFATYSDNEPHADSRGNSYAKYNTVVLVSTQAFEMPDETHHHRDYYNSPKKAGFLAEPENKGELYPPGQDDGAKFLK